MECDVTISKGLFSLLLLRMFTSSFLQSLQKLSNSKMEDRCYTFSHIVVAPYRSHSVRKHLSTQIIAVVGTYIKLCCITCEHRNRKAQNALHVLKQHNIHCVLSQLHGPCNPCNPRKDMCADSNIYVNTHSASALPTALAANRVSGLCSEGHMYLWDLSWYVPCRPLHSRDQHLLVASTLKNI